MHLTRCCRAFDEHLPIAEDTALSSNGLAALIERSKSDADAKKALMEASKAAAHNKQLMDTARNILQQSAKDLGKDAIALPSLGKFAAPLSRRAEKHFVHATRFAREY